MNQANIPVLETKQNQAFLEIFGTTFMRLSTREIQQRLPSKYSSAWDKTKSSIFRNIWYNFYDILPEKYNKDFQ